jgi:hypothetical protein
LLLGFDRWDDYDYKTTFPTTCRMNDSIVDLESVKILISDQKISYAYLDGLVENGWNGVFPVPDTHYVSVPQTITFYEQIVGYLGDEIALQVAQLLKDASYMVWIQEDDVSRALADTDGFKSSLQRERGSKSAYLNTWKLFNKAGIIVSNFSFKFKDPSDQIQGIEFNFDPKNILPHDINVLIGANGVGKSQTLMRMVEDWLDFDSEEKSVLGFTENLNINQLIVVSYSPFERFPVDANNKKLHPQGRRDVDIYRYFGLRGRAVLATESGESSTRIRLSQQWPKTDAALSLIACLADDQRYGLIKDWSAKIKTMQRVLRTAIDFDYAAVVVEKFENIDLFFDFKENIEADAFIEIPLDHEDPDSSVAFHIPIAEDRVDELLPIKIHEHVRSKSGVVFIKNGKPVELSSGQRLFSYIVINILGAIRRNSLILIDEPELFLHPTLEISFIAMLKDILTSFNSKAILATHSLVTVRELPRDCVHVFEKTDDGLFIKHPPFETFGGDIQRISSYVFGDKSVSKPFEALLRQKLDEYGSAENLISALGDDINEEMIIQISAMEAGKW